jgi:hypothetical protein
VRGEVEETRPANPRALELFQPVGRRSPRIDRAVGLQQREQQRGAQRLRQRGQIEGRRGIERHARRLEHGPAHRTTRHGSLDSLDSLDAPRGPGREPVVHAIEEQPPDLGGTGVAAHGEDGGCASIAARTRWASSIARHA